jgi:AcrR family transcriptional regulator
MTAGERREMVLQAALTEFAGRGLDGTSTQAIARRAGISRPYLFRLFPAKKALFLSVVQRCFQQVTQVLPHRGRRPGRRGRAPGHGERLRPAVPAADAAADATARLRRLHRPDVRAVTRAAYGDLRDSIDHPEAAADRMRWVRSLLGLAPS